MQMTRVTGSIGWLWSVLSCANFGPVVGAKFNLQLRGVNPHRSLVE